MRSLSLPVAVFATVVAITIGLAGFDQPDDPDATAANTPDGFEKLEIEEWPVPYAASRPRDPYVAPDGRVWFCGQRTGYLAVFDPEDGSFEKYELGEGAGPHNLIVDDEGYVWYAGNRRAHIGRLDPKTGDIVKYPMPDAASRDPHTLIFDGKGGIYFTLQGANRIGHLDMESGKVRIAEVETTGSRPYGIWLAPSGESWVALFGTNKLARVDPETLALTEIDLPRETTRPRRLVVTSDGLVWYVDYADGMMGRYDPETGEVEEWPMPSGENARPYAMIVDEADVVWFVETGPRPNRFVGFDPATEEFIHGTPIPSGAGSVRHMYLDPKTRSIWFGTDANTIGRAKLP